MNVGHYVDDPSWILGAALSSAAATAVVLGVLSILVSFGDHSNDNNNDECVAENGEDSRPFPLCVGNFVAVVVEVSVVVQVTMMTMAVLCLLLLIVGEGPALWSQRLRSFRFSTLLQRQQLLLSSLYSRMMNELVRPTLWRRKTTLPAGEATQELFLLSSEQVDLVAKRQWSEVLAWIVFHPDELRHGVDRQGQTFLHHACLFRAPAEVLQMILWQAPELAARANPHGQVPLHWAVRLSLPNECLRALILAAPKTPCWSEDLLDTTTPLSLLWDRHRDCLWRAWEQWQRRQQESTATTSRTITTTTVQEQEQQQGNDTEQNHQITEHFFQFIENVPAWKRIILCWPCRCQSPSSELITDPVNYDEEYQYDTYQHHHRHHNTRGKGNGETLLRFLETPLHVASRSPCPPDLYSFLLESQVFSSSSSSKDVMTRDSWGRLPLHVVCSNVTTNRSTSAATTVGTASEIDVVGAGPGPEEERAATAACNPTKLQQWLRSRTIPDPKTACCTRDYQGRTPFHCALASGMSWEEGIQDMILLDPDWMLRDGPAVRDPVSLLLPFLLAAAATVSTTTTTTTTNNDEDDNDGGGRNEKNNHNNNSSSNSDENHFVKGENDDDVADTITLVAAPLDTIYNILRMDPTHIILASLPHTTYR